MFTRRMRCWTPGNVFTAHALLYLCKTLLYLCICKLRFLYPNETQVTIQQSWICNLQLTPSRDGDSSPWTRTRVGLESRSCWTRTRTRVLHIWTRTRTRTRDMRTRTRLGLGPSGLGRTRQTAQIRIDSRLLIT